jgi:hypothetical protein
MGEVKTDLELTPRAKRQIFYVSRWKITIESKADSQEILVALTDDQGQTIIKIGYADMEAFRLPEKILNEHLQQALVSLASPLPKATLNLTASASSAVETAKDTGLELEGINQEIQRLEQQIAELRKLNDEDDRKINLKKKEISYLEQHRSLQKPGQLYYLELDLFKLIEGTVKRYNDIKSLSERLQNLKEASVTKSLASSAVATYIDINELTLLGNIRPALLAINGKNMWCDLQIKQYAPEQQTYLIIRVKAETDYPIYSAYLGNNLTPVQIKRVLSALQSSDQWPLSRIARPVSGLLNQLEIALKTPQSVKPDAELAHGVIVLDGIVDNKFKLGQGSLKAAVLEPEVIRAPRVKPSSINNDLKKIIELINSKESGKIILTKAALERVDFRPYQMLDTYSREHFDSEDDFANEKMTASILQYLRYILLDGPRSYLNISDLVFYLRILNLYFYDSRKEWITPSYLQDSLKSVRQELEKTGKVTLYYAGANASSPVESKAPEKIGAIDFRAINMSIQPMGSFAGLNFKLPQLTQAQLKQINIESEIEQVKNLIESGTVPSADRIKELIAACSQKGQISAYADNLLLCLADICKLQEQNAFETSKELKEALVIVDSMAGQA